MKHLVLLAAAVFAADSFAIVNGYSAASGQLPAVVYFKGNGICSSVIVGPRVLLTAAQCVKEGELAEVEIGGDKYRVVFSRSPYYPGTENDLAAGVADRKLPVYPLSLQKTVTVGTDVQLAGYGCDKTEGDYDPILRFGFSRISARLPSTLVTEQPDGAAACFGDSGGPLLYLENGRTFVAGIMAMGNLQDKTYSTRLDSPESEKFLRDFAQKNKVEVCGLTRDCH